MKKRIEKFFRKVQNAIKKPEMRILPGQLAFFLVLSIIPLVALLAAIASHFSISIESLIELVDRTIPKEAAELITQAIDGKSLNLNIAIFYGSAFLLASNGPHSMIIGSNLLYKVEDKDYLTRRIKALFMTFVLVLLLVFLLIVPAYGDMIISLITQVLESKELNHLINVTYSILKYPISLFFIFFCVKLLYTMAPDKTIPSSSTTYGAIFTTVSWIIATEVYSFYVEVFAKYNLLYGSIANLLILLLWVYLLSYIFVLGMAFNTSSDLNKEEKEV
ncbi:MAG: YihY/virulence factor BrkB family protein, partial [Bacilli bacterium]|nr:YihY/virulence factor BrkB family protein [Bacilli bacterium]